jgi:hypothetical protein
MEQASALDPCNESIASGSLKSRIASSTISPWPYIKNQFAEIEHIDTHAPLALRSSRCSIDGRWGCVWADHDICVAGDKILLLDLLAIHMVRDVKGSTVISYHHTVDGSTTAKDLFTRLKLVGRSVYWCVWRFSRKFACSKTASRPGR